MIELVETDFTQESMQSRVMKTVSLLRLIAEFVKSYPDAVSHLLEMKHQKNSIISWVILQNLLTENQGVDVPIVNSEVAIAAKAVLTNIVSWSSNINFPKVNEVIVDEIKAILHSIIVNAINDKLKLAEKMSTLAKLVIILKESAQVYF